MFELEEVRTWERNPQLYADILASSLAGAGAVHARAGARARPPRAVEAAADAAPHPGGARQHQGAAGHLRQGRHRDVARRAEVHRRRSAARVLERRRPAPARRSRRRADRGVAGASAPTSSTSRPRSRRRRARRSGSGREQVRAEAAARRRASRMPVDRLLAIAMRELHDDAGSVPDARRHA